MTTCAFPYTRGDRRGESYGSWMYNYLFNQCISPLKLLGIRTPFMVR